MTQQCDESKTQVFLYFCVSVKVKGLKCRIKLTIFICISRNLPCCQEWEWINCMEKTGYVNDKLSSQANGGTKKLDIATLLLHSPVKWNRLYHPCYYSRLGMSGRKFSQSALDIQSHLRACHHLRVSYDNKILHLQPCISANISQAALPYKIFNQHNSFYT